MYCIIYIYINHHEVWLAIAENSTLVLPYCSYSKIYQNAGCLQVVLLPMKPQPHPGETAAVICHITWEQWRIWEWAQPSADGFWPAASSSREMTSHDAGIHCQCTRLLLCFANATTSLQIQLHFRVHPREDMGLVLLLLQYLKCKHLYVQVTPRLLSSTDSFFHSELNLKLNSDQFPLQ